MLITVLFVEGLTTVMPSMDFLFLIARSSSGERVFAFSSVLSLFGAMMLSDISLSGTSLPDTSFPGIFLFDMSLFGVPLPRVPIFIAAAPGVPEDSSCSPQRSGNGSVSVSGFVSGISSSSTKALSASGS